VGLALALVGLTMGLIGLVVALAHTMETGNAKIFKPDLASIIGVAIAALVLIGAIALLATSVKTHVLGLAEYAFVQSGKTLRQVFHNPAGMTLYTLKSTNVVKSSTGFQAALLVGDGAVSLTTRDGVPLTVELVLAYKIEPNVDDPNKLSYGLWRLGSAETVRDVMATPQVGQAARMIIGNYDALPAVSTHREEIRAAIFKRLNEVLPPQGLKPLGLTMLKTEPHESIKEAWIERAKIEIDPALSSHKLEEQRIGSVAGANAIFIPANTALHVSLPGQTPPSDASV
jgi:regulator of protease activity HflC (stomatin/prohibitin superfamily)